MGVEGGEGSEEEESECDICSEDCASDMELDKEVEVSTEAPEVEREVDPFIPRRPLTVTEVDDLVRYGTELLALHKEKSNKCFGCNLCRARKKFIVQCLDRLIIAKLPSDEDMAWCGLRLCSPLWKKANQDGKKKLMAEVGWTGSNNVQLL